MPDALDPRLEPDTAALLAKILAGQAPPADQSMAERRTAYTDFSKSMAGDGEPVAAVESITVPGGAGPIPARLYRPTNDETAPIIVYTHGGGFIFGDLESHDAICRLLAVRTQANVLAIQYRLAPEALFPAALDDCVAAITDVLDHPERYHADAARVAIAGESAGAALSISSAIKLKARDVARPAALLLFVPAIDSACATPSATEFASGYGPSAEEFRMLWSQYVPDPAQRADPAASPFYATDLAGLPPFAIYTAECDPARDEGEIFAGKLGDAGVEVLLHRGTGLIHFFPNMLGTSKAALAQMIAAAEALGAVFARGGTAP